MFPNIYDSSPGQQTAEAGLVPCKDCIISQQDTVVFNWTYIISILHSYQRRICTSFVLLPGQGIQSSYNPLLKASSNHLLPLASPQKCWVLQVYTSFVPHYIGYVSTASVGVNPTARKSQMLWLSIPYKYTFVDINYSPGFVLIPYYAKERQISNKGRLHGCHIYSGQWHSIN